MTQYELLQAIPALQTLSKFKLPVKKAYSIYNLCKTANESKDFFIEQERKLIEEFKGTVNENGQITFENSDDFKGFAEKYNDLKALESDAEAVTLSASELGDQTISVEDIALLDGIITFAD